jgi:hypothetical protein
MCWEDVHTLASDDFGEFVLLEETFCTCLPCVPRPYRLLPQAAKQDKERKKRHTAHGLSANRNLLKGVPQYLALTMLRTQSQSSMASMMMALLTCCDSCRVSSDDFISATTTSQLESGSGFLWQNHVRNKGFVS